MPRVGGGVDDGDGGVRVSGVSVAPSGIDDRRRRHRGWTGTGGAVRRVDFIVRRQDTPACRSPREEERATEHDTSGQSMRHAFTMPHLREVKIRIFHFREYAVSIQSRRVVRRSQPLGVSCSLGPTSLGQTAASETS